MLQNQLESNLGGVDMVIGAKGSPIQVILSSIFHIDNQQVIFLYLKLKK